MEEDMQSKLLDERDGKRTFAVVLQTGDEAMRCLQDFAGKERIGGAQITAIGALSGAKLAYFDWEAESNTNLFPSASRSRLPRWLAISPSARTASRACISMPYSDVATARPLPVTLLRRR